VGGAVIGSRALDFSSNTAQPGNPGPLAAVTNANLGFGVVSNFVVSFWLKQHALMAQGTNVGPRLFVMGSGTPADTGAADSIGMKFQTSSQLYFQVGGLAASATFATNLPANTWLFVAAVYDGANLMLYQGSDTNSASLISTTASTNINFGTTAALYIGDRQNLQRSFDGWLDDFRFYTGVGDANFVESIRLQALTPPPRLSIQASGAKVTLTWPTGTLQTATSLLGTWSNISNATSPYTVPAAVPHQFYRLRVP